MESYRGESDDLDLAFWNVRGLDWNAREPLAEVAQVIADMGMDLWWLEHADAGSGGQLSATILESRHDSLTFDVSSRARGRPPTRWLCFIGRDKGLVIERRSLGGRTRPEGPSLPAFVHGQGLDPPFGDVWRSSS